RLNGASREQRERYLMGCEQLAPQEYYSTPHGGQSSSHLGTSLARVFRDGRAKVAWRSPVNTPFSANNIAHAEFFPCAQGATAPTVFLLHSLMSTKPIGYRRRAQRVNELGWSACLLYLPYHFSRVRIGSWYCSLAITCV